MPPVSLPVEAGDPSMPRKPPDAPEASRMKRWLAQLSADLAALESRHLLRRLRCTEHDGDGPHVTREGRRLLNLAGNDYLALSQHPMLRAAAIAAVERSGVGAGASRLVSGHLPEHAQAQDAVARLKHAEAALLFPTGFMANLAVLTALAGPGDLLLLDKLNHASLIDAARASGATLRVYPHLGYEKLQRLLQQRGKAAANAVGEADAKPQAARAPRTFIVTDSVFSMDGDVADMVRICDLAEAHDAMVIVDEAHGTGTLGKGGAGLCEAQGVTHRVDVVVSTASKALGGLGGIVTGARVVIDTLVNHARSFIYTTAVPPAQAAAITAAVEVLAREPERRERLTAMSQHVRHELASMGLIPPPAPATTDRPHTPIVPIVVGDEARALSLADRLERAGIMAPAIRPPTVAPGSARVRLTLRADLQDGHLDQLYDALRTWKRGN